MLSEALELVNLLKQKSLSISVAESCTGGFVSKSITDVSGSSEVFPGGVVSYSNTIKENILGVNHNTLLSFGAVSAECAKEMALGIKKLCSTDIGISTTGIAGPGGGTKEKPIGTVYVAISFKDFLYAENLMLSSNLSRDEIRTQTVKKLLQLTADKISEKY